MSEQARFDFVLKRDGLEAANDFAARAYKQYRSGLYGRKAMQNPQFRGPWLKSAIEFRHILMCRGANEV